MAQPASATTTSAGDERTFVSKINSERVQRGVRALAVKSDLTEVARRHSRRMAEEGRIWHNPNLSSEVRGWDRLGENVGMGGDAYVIHDAFMDSPNHRANILERDYTEIGVGVALNDGGTLFVTEVFARRAVAPRRASQPAPATAPTKRTATHSTPARSGATEPAPRRRTAVAPARATRAPAPRASAKPAPQSRNVEVLVAMVGLEQQERSRPVWRPATV